MNENDELLDLVDIDDIVVGTVRREDMVKVGYKSTQGYVRFAEAFLLNGKGEIWVPIRGMHKAIAPGGCDFSVAEHVLSGESYEQAIERAFLEEAGMKVDYAALIPIGKLSPTDSPYTNQFTCISYVTVKAQDTVTRNFPRRTGCQWKH